MAGSLNVPFQSAEDFVFRFKGNNLTIGINLLKKDDADANISPSIYDIGRRISGGEAVDLLLEDIPVHEREGVTINNIHGLAQNVSCGWAVTRQ